MSYYNVMFWKNADKPRLGPPDKNLHVTADSQDAAVKKAQQHFDLQDSPLPWAHRVDTIHEESTVEAIESPAAAPAVPSAAGDGEQAQPKGRRK